MHSRTRRQLSTGHEVDLPLELSFAMGGVIVPARRRRLASVLPEGVVPLAIAPGVSPVTLVGIGYRRVGRPSADGPEEPGEATGLEPYDEFAVIVPAVTGDSIVGGFAGDVGGYVHWLPVTTEASVALGRELWGYPKEVADVTVTDGPNGIRTVLEVDGERVLRLDVPRGRRREREWTMQSYTTKDGTLLRTRVEIEGPVALRSGIGVSLEWGQSEVADDLRQLGIRGLPLARLYGSRVGARLFDGEPVR